MRIARLLLFLLLATPAFAQTLRWSLPPLGAAEYRRTLRERSVTAESLDKAKAAAANEPVPPAYLPELAPGPLLCEGELDDDAQRVTTPVRDLRDVLRTIAFDLGASGSSSWKFARMVPFGDLSASGSVSPFDANGAQRIELALARKAATKLPDDPKSGRYEFEAMFAFDARGTIAMQRTVDAQRGLVTGFRATLTLFVHEDTKREDEWELVAVRENQDADFRKRVAEAVRRGSAWVREQLADDSATWTRDKKDEAFTFGSGRLALAALTLLHAEVPPTEHVVGRRNFCAHATARGSSADRPRARRSARRDAAAQDDGHLLARDRADGDVATLRAAARVGDGPIRRRGTTRRARTAAG